MTSRTTKEFAKQLKKIELHRHLAGSVRFSTLREFLPPAAKTSSDQSDDEATRNYFCVTEAKQDLKEVLDRFVHVQALFVDAPFVKRVTYEIVEDAVNDNIVLLELRYSPGFIIVSVVYMTCFPLLTRIF
jgi:adenosine deaminase